MTPTGAAPLDDRTAPGLGRRVAFFIQTPRPPPISPLSLSLFYLSSLDFFQFFGFVLIIITIIIFWFFFFFWAFGVVIILVNR